MLVFASIANLFPQPALLGTGNQNFPSPSRAAWPSAYEGMISSRGVAKKRRAQVLAAFEVKCSQGVAAAQQSWRGGNHLLGSPSRIAGRLGAAPTAGALH